MRESPALDIIELLKRRGATVTYTDPFVPVLRHGPVDLTSMALDEALAAGCDCAVIVTDHTAFDYPAIARRFPLVVDTRNALEGPANADRVPALDPDSDHAMAKTALITGITGQDGSYLAELLLAKGYKVVGAVRRLSAPNQWRIAHLRRPDHASAGRSARPALADQA